VNDIKNLYVVMVGHCVGFAAARIVI